VSVDEAVAGSIKQGVGSYLTIYNPNPVANEGDHVSPVELRKPLILNAFWYLLWSLLGFGWIIRIIIYSKSISLNVFMKKVILR
jgi:hypothetical protein